MESLGVERYFNLGLTGQSDYLPDQRTRARWLVADAFREQAKTEERSMATRLRGEAGKIEGGGYRPSKKVLGKVGSKRLEKIFVIFVRLYRQKIKAA